VSAPKPITFTRSAPSKFVLLVANSQESGIVGGAEDPGGTELATDRDMRDAGYMPAMDGWKLLALVKEAAAAAEQADDRLGKIAQHWVEQAERIMSGTITQG
jgi:hypothetical protein